MSTSLRFDCFEVDLAAGRIFKHGARLHLREQPFQVLAMLLERPGDVVTRDELRQRLWPDDVFVDFDNNLNTAVARLREVLNDSPEHPRFIETLPRRGYRLIASLSAPAPAPQPARAERVRVLVLPFVNLGGDASEAYVDDAMTDEVIIALAALAPEALAVIARTTAMRYKTSQKDVARIGRELGVEYLVEGAVRSGKESVAVSAQLVRASDQSHLWAKRYESLRDEAFGVAGPIAQAVAGALGIGVGSGEKIGRRTHQAKRIPRDAVAYEEYVRARQDLESLVEVSRGFPNAKVLLERAIARDPDFARAHEALAQMYWFLGYGGAISPRDAVAAGIPHAVRALEIDGTSAEARALAAQFYKQLDYNWPNIEGELARALELNPASSLVRVLNAVGWLMPQGRVTEAVAELERTLERDPLSYHVRYWLTIMLVLARDWDRTVEQAHVLIEREPLAPFGPWLLHGGLRGQGRLDESVAAQRRAVELSGDTPMMLGWLGLILGISGRTAEARSVLARLEEAARTRWVPPSCFAWIYLGVRDVDRAFEWMDRAVDARDQFMMPIKTYVFFDPIRGDPRFHALLRKMDLG